MLKELWNAMGWDGKSHSRQFNAERRTNGWMDGVLENFNAWTQRGEGQEFCD
jgi:hypothetical protein